MASVELRGLVERYQRGATLVALAAEVGCHPVTIRRRLLAAGVTLRSSGEVERRDPQWWRDQIAGGRSEPTWLMSWGWLPERCTP